MGDWSNGSGNYPDDCYTRKVNGPDMTANQFEVILSSVSFAKHFLPGTRTIRNASEPLTLLKNSYFWNNQSLSNDVICSLTLTPERWSFTNGSFASSLNYGCNNDEACCGVLCCQYITTLRIIFCLSLLGLAFVFLVLSGEVESMRKIVEKHNRSNHAALQLQPLPQPQVPVELELTSTSTIIPVVRVDQHACPASRKTISPSFISENSCPSTYGNQHNSDEELPKYSELFPSRHENR